MLKSLLCTLLLVPSFVFAEGLVSVKFDNPKHRFSKANEGPTVVYVNSLKRLDYTSLTHESHLTVIVANILRSQGLRLPDLITSSDDSLEHLPQIQSVESPGLLTTIGKALIGAGHSVPVTRAFKFFVDSNEYTCGAIIQSENREMTQIKEAIIQCPREIKEKLGFDVLRVRDLSL